jgi:hypothetical protein
VTLAAEQWRMVVGVAASRCVADVADRLGLGEYGVCKALKDLVESGVVDINDPPGPAKAEVKASEPKIEAKIEKIEPAAKPEPARQPEPPSEPEAKTDKAESDKSESDKPEAKAVIEPELKPLPDPDGTVRVKALTTTDQASPIPPGDEPDAHDAHDAKAKKAEPVPKAAKPEAKAEPKVDPSQAKALVSQLAAMGSEKSETKTGTATTADKGDKAEKSEKAPAPKAKADKDTDTEAAEGDAEAPAAASSTAAAQEGEAEEPLNRGLLLKFLSSVRQ